MSITPDDRPQREQLMDPTSPAAPTMGASDTQEHEMTTPTRQPSTDPGRGRRRAYIAGCLVAAVAAATAGVVLLSGGDSEPAAAPTTPPAPPPTSAVPSPPPSAAPRPADVAAAAAKAKYLQYVSVNDAVAQGGYKNLKPYDAVAIDPERAELTAAARRLAGIRTTGASEVATLGVQSVKLATNPKFYSDVRLTGCLDVRGVKAFRADGSSAVTATRLPRIAFAVLVQKIPAAAFTDGRPGGWYVAKVEYPGGGTAC